MATPRKRTAVKTAAETVSETAEAVKTEAKKPAARRSTAKKTAAKKEVKAQVFVQYLGKEISADSLVEEAKKAFVAAGHKESEIKTISVYVKPEENAAYYAVNGAGSEEYKIQL
ncbi:MAG: hypothetical protein KH353_09215 [Clostridium sp.]|nr:hypothetical protein [Clostridium sp.]